MSSSSDTFKDYVIGEFLEDYQENRLSRREALRRLAALTGSMAAASTLLAACAPSTPPPSPTAVPPTPVPVMVSTIAGPGVSPDDPSLIAQEVQFPGPSGTIFGYLARPRGQGTFPAVLICHENVGLLPHFADVARRFAKAGYVGLPIDLLSREGGTEKVTDSAQRSAILGTSQVDRFVEDFQAAFRYLQGQAYVRGDRIGITGFCFGGGVIWRVATKTPEVRAAVSFYGRVPPVEEVPDLRAAVLGIYGELDTRVNAGIPTIETAMKQHGKIFEKVIYPNAQHAFFNEDKPDSYHSEAARDSWIRGVGWFDKYLKA